MNNLYNLKETEGTRDLKYYQALTTSIIQAGYADLESDSDSRIQEAYRYLVDNKIECTLKDGFDFVADLRLPGSPHHKLTQPRINSTDRARVDKFYDMFYCDMQQQNKISIMIEMEGLHYPLFGNHRAEAHRKAQVEGKSVNESVLVIGQDMPITKKKLLASKFAGISNKETTDDVETIGMRDYVSILQTRFEIEEEIDPAKMHWGIPQKVEWGKDALREEFPTTFKGDSQVKFLSRTVNLAFDTDNLKMNLPFPPEDLVDVVWKKFFPDDDWSPSDQEHIVQKSLCTNPTVFAAWLGNLILEGSGSHANECWFAVRIGASLDSTTNKKQTVVDGRRRYLQLLQKYNLNTRVVLAGVPKITKVLFVNQLGDGSAEAHAWNPQKLDFNALKSK
mgnify:CR=1 FL=1